MKSRIKVNKGKTKNEDIEDVIMPARKVKSTSRRADTPPANDNVESTIEDD